MQCSDKHPLLVLIASHLVPSLSADPNQPPYVIGYITEITYYPRIHYKTLRALRAGPQAQGGSPQIHGVTPDKKNTLLALPRSHLRAGTGTVYKYPKFAERHRPNEKNDAPVPLPQSKSKIRAPCDRGGTQATKDCACANPYQPRPP
jgi:hypothetical protein